MAKGTLCWRVVKFDFDNLGWHSFNGWVVKSGSNWSTTDVGRRGPCSTSEHKVVRHGCESMATDCRHLLS